MLVAISIPIFSSQLKKARDATDVANVRSAYAEIVTKQLMDDSTNLDATIVFKGDGSTSSWNGVDMAGLTLETSMHPGSGSHTITFAISADGKCTGITKKS